MNVIAKHIQSVNEKNRKVLSVFLTAGFPDPRSFVELSLKILDAGADFLEIGIPFSDPIADGPVIQASSMQALENGVQLAGVLDFIQEIRKETDKPLILMGYANPILHFGLDKFLEEACEAGVNGIIIPDIPLEEYDDFWGDKQTALARIMLTTPTSSAERIQKIDTVSRGFVYCVSVTGTTGMQKGFGKAVINNLERTYKLITKNKMLIGFGISTPENIRHFSPYCDGVIVGSAVIKHLLAETDKYYHDTCRFVRSLSAACR